jgi:hypothetical protein
MPDVLSEADRTALASVLDQGERVELAAAAVGCALVLTDRRLLLIREGASYRPKTGVHAWPLDRGLVIRFAAGRRNAGRLIIDYGGQTTSLFLAVGHTADARALVAETRMRTHPSEG